MTLDAMRLCGWCRAVPLLDARARFCGRRCRQSAWRLRERAALDPSPTSAPQRFAYADPPYPTLAARYYADEPTYAGEVDHGALLARLTTGDYDGWALSTSARALRLVLPLCPGRVRIGAGVQRDALVFSLGAFGVEVSPGAPPDAPVPSAPAVETLTTWAAVWMGRRTSTGAVRWPRDDRYRWEKHIAGSPLAALPLVDIRPRDVRAWLDGMMGKRKAGGAPLSRQTITHAFNLVRKALADAAADERIPSNPAAGLTVPKRAKKRDTDPWTHLTAEEVRAVEACEAMPEHLRLLFVVAIYTGLRAGELWARRWADVVTDGTACVTVRASHKNAPKNGKVQRVPLLPAARAAFEALRALGAGDLDGEALVFPSVTGRQRPRSDDAGWSSRKRRKVFVAGLQERAGITRRVRFHDLRHTFASPLVMGTWTTAALPLAEVRSMMRHGSIAMTERYAHLGPEHLHARIAAAPTAPAAPLPVVTNRHD